MKHTYPSPVIRDFVVSAECYCLSEIQSLFWNQTYNGRFSFNKSLFNDWDNHTKPNLALSSSVSVFWEFKVIIAILISPLPLLTFWEYLRPEVASINVKYPTKTQAFKGQRQEFCAFCRINLRTTYLSNVNMRELLVPGSCTCLSMWQNKHLIPNNRAYIKHFSRINIFKLKYFFKQTIINK